MIKDILTQIFLIPLFSFLSTVQATQELKLREAISNSLESIHDDLKVFHPQIIQYSEKVEQIESNCHKIKETQNISENYFKQYGNYIKEKISHLEEMRKVFDTHMAWVENTIQILETDILERTLTPPTNFKAYNTNEDYYKDESQKHLKAYLESYENYINSHKHVDDPKEHRHHYLIHLHSMKPYLKVIKNLIEIHIKNIKEITSFFIQHKDISIVSLKF